MKVMGDSRSKIQDPRFKIQDPREESLPAEGSDGVHVGGLGGGDGGAQDAGDDAGDEDDHGVPGIDVARDFGEVVDAGVPDGDAQGRAEPLVDGVDVVDDEEGAQAAEGGADDPDGEAVADPEPGDAGAAGADGAEDADVTGLL